MFESSIASFQQNWKELSHFLYPLLKIVRNTVDFVRCFQHTNKPKLTCTLCFWPVCDESEKPSSFYVNWVNAKLSSFIFRHVWFEQISWNHINIRALKLQINCNYLLIVNLILYFCLLNLSNWLFWNQCSNLVLLAHTANLLKWMSSFLPTFRPILYIGYQYFCFYSFWISQSVACLLLSFKCLTKQWKIRTWLSTRKV